MGLRVPFVIKNTTDIDCKIGQSWFRPGGEVLISNSTFYNTYKGEIHSLIDSDKFVVIKEIGVEEAPPVAETPVVKDEAPAEDKNETSHDVKNKDDIRVDLKSPIDKFVDKDVHWTHVVKEIEDTKDVGTIESYLVDANFHGLDKESVVMKALNKRIKELSKK